MDPKRQTVRLGFGKLPKHVLQHIFALGVRDSWTEAEDEDMASINTLSSEEDYEEYPFFLSRKNQSSYSQKLDSIMSCAMVCRKWANAVLDMRFWEENQLLTEAEDHLQPWKMGTRWNKFLANVPVVVPCSGSQLLCSIGKIEFAASVGRTSFTVYIPVRIKRRENMCKAWQLLRSFLWKHCTHLELVSYDEDRDYCLDLGDVIFKPWPRLQSLKLESLLKSPKFLFCSPSTKAFAKLRSTPEDTLKQNPFFPTLKHMSFQAHPNQQLARDVLLLAPDIEECLMDTSGFPKEPESESRWDMNRHCISHLKFLEEDKKFRTFVTPFCMHAFKWPGPKRPGKFGGDWKFKALMCHSPEYGVFISETRDGRLCELQMSLDDFFAEEDLTRLVIPMRHV